MRFLPFILVVSILSCSAIAHAQGPAPAGSRRVSVTLAVMVPGWKPALSSRTLLLQTGAGILGGFAGASVAALPLMLSSWSSPVEEALLLGLIGGAYVAGTTAGIHYVGRARGLSASPWISAAGVVGGLAVSGAMMQPFIDEEGNAGGPAPLLVFVLPSMGGTAGYALTRRARE